MPIGGIGGGGGLSGPGGGGTGGSLGGFNTGAGTGTTFPPIGGTSQLSYNGVPLLTPSPEIMAWVSANITTRELFDFQRELWPTQNLASIPFPGQMRARPVKPHTLWWPTGASRWAVGYFFCSSNELAAIRSFSSGAYQTYPFVMNDGLRPAVTTNLWMLPPRPLSSVPGGNNLWLLTFVDDRYWWWFNSTGALFITANTTTWANLYTSLGTQLNLTIQVDAINANYLKPSSSLTANYEYLPLILDAVAYNVGQRIVRGLDGTVHAWNIGTSQTQLQTNLQQAPVAFRAGGILQGIDAPAVLPATVTVTFPTDGGTGAPANSAPYTVSATLAALNIPGLGVTGAPFTKIFHSSTTATFTGSSTPSNSATLQSLVNQIATDWYQYQVSPLDVRYNGIIPWIPEGLSDAIEWTYSASPKELSTRIQRPAWNDLALQFLQGEPPATGAKITRQSFTASGTYTPTLGTVALWVRLWGSGGGGGGTQITGVGQVAAGGGGGGGGYSEYFVSSFSFATATVTVDTGGIGNNGGTGGNAGTTSFVGTGVNFNVLGGKGGGLGVASAGPIVSIGGAGATLPGFGNTPNVATGGSPGGLGYASVSLGLISGSGGTCAGGAGTLGTTSTATGPAGTSIGSGGAGAAATASQAAQTGGHGAAGQVEVYEYTFA